MKSAIVIASDGKQVMLTPENENEERALEFLKDPDSDISIEFKTGGFYETHNAVGYDVSMCKGGYYRAFPDGKSLMIVLTKKKK